MSAPDDRDRDDETREPAADPPDALEPRPSEPGDAASSDADPGDFEPGDADLEDSGLDEVDLRDMLRGALRPPQGAVAPSLLRGVQGRLRARSKGKFYGDGWSTSQSPRSTYLVTSIVMLAVIALVFLVLIPWGTPP
jgi:hypothetical protein